MLDSDQKEQIKNGKWLGLLVSCLLNAILVLWVVYTNSVSEYKDYSKENASKASTNYAIDKRKSDSTNAALQARIDVLQYRYDTTVIGNLRDKTRSNAMWENMANEFAKTLAARDRKLSRITKKGEQVEKLSREIEAKQN